MTKKKRHKSAYYRNIRTYRKNRIFVSRDGNRHGDTDYFFYVHKTRPNILHLKIREYGMTVIDFMEYFRKNYKFSYRTAIYNWVNGTHCPRKEKFRKAIARFCCMKIDDVFDINPKTMLLAIRPATNVEITNYVLNQHKTYLGDEVFGTIKSFKKGRPMHTEPED
jgi:hypothetical protein